LEDLVRAKVTEKAQVAAEVVAVLMEDWVG
jgi:hypothetical protein